MSTISSDKINKLISFERDANVLLVGPTSSGKTTLLKEILDGALWGEHDPREVFVLVPEETRADWHSGDRKISVIAGRRGLEGFLAHRSQTPENSIVVFDDWMTALDDANTRREVEQFFFVTTHHRHLWTFFVTHDMFNINMKTIRRNAQCFILFNLFQSDARAAQDFISRTFGTQSGSALMALWKSAVGDTSKGWIRIDQRLRGQPGLPTVISAGGITRDTVWLAARSSTADGPLYLDAIAPPERGESPTLEVPRGSSTEEDDYDDRDGEPTYLDPEESAGGLPADGTSNLQQPDRY